MNFNIVENPDFEFEDILEDFAEQYNNPNIMTDDIRKNLGLSGNEYIKVRREAINRGLCVTRKNVNKVPKYYHYNDVDGTWIVTKSIDGKKKYFCTCRSEEEAKFMVDKYLENGWDNSKNDLYKEMFNMSR